MRSYGAGYWQTLCRLRLPAALPFLFNALKINSTLALIGAIVAEFFGTPIVGMGFRISTEVGRMALDMVWAEIVVAALAGSAFYGALALLERGVDLLASFAPAVRADENKGETDMKKTMLTARGASRSASARRAGADKLTLQLKWVTQAQFAGYYVAKDKGFYKEAGLDVDDQAGRTGHRPAAGHRRRRRRRRSSTGCRPRSPRARRAWRWSISPSRSSARA